jgi:hypothetical protein
MTTLDIWQWAFMVGTSLLLFAISPWSNDVGDFFRGNRKNKEPSSWVLLSSLVIGWLFAKSITNAADLGYKFGVVGSLAYGAYYLSFLVAGLVIYSLRVKGGFNSIHDFLSKRFGQGAVVLFTLLITFRLLNEIWSNTLVVGSYFGTSGSASSYWAMGIFTALTLAYTMKAGMQTSLATDLIQMGFFVVLLFFLLGFLLPHQPIQPLLATGSWTWGQGVNLLLVALIQVLSYPFHDPIMTDRAFITKSNRLRPIFLGATVVGFICIFLFSLIGIYARIQGMASPPIQSVTTFMGPVFLLGMNLIMLTSAASTIDSSFTSAVKLVHLDILKGRNLSVPKARWTMTWIAIFGTIPVFFDPDILSATTISGTSVLGLAPIFLFWQIKAPPLSFYLSISIGLLASLVYIFNLIPENYWLTPGTHGDLLTVNVVGTLGCFLGYFIPIAWKSKN